MRRKCSCLEPQRLSTWPWKDRDTVCSQLKVAVDCWHVSVPPCYKESSICSLSVHLLLLSSTPVESETRESNASLAASEEDEEAGERITAPSPTMHAPLFESSFRSRAPSSPC